MLKTRSLSLGDTPSGLMYFWCQIGFFKVCYCSAQNMFAVSSSNSPLTKMEKKSLCVQAVCKRYYHIQLFKLFSSILTNSIGEVQ